ncbi:MAG: DUF2911 domain-containing protein [Cyclobacteriaceae bacterium]|nr:DUF2911 domain-containing protein [Cyclobacteriaceae bacterium HetDA_MAG_MS6]
MKLNLKLAIGIFFFWTTSSLALGQVEYPSLSPKGRITQIVGNTNIEIEYERPSARNRVVFGELVPWNKVWRTGAGYCTKIAFDQKIIIGGQSVNPGKYSLFTIPNPKEWIVILNSDTTLYGSFNYNPEKDVTRFIVKPFNSQRFYETLTFNIDLIPNNARVFISWEKTQISFGLQTSTDEEIQSFISERLLTRKEKSSDKYAKAAEYLHYQNINTFEAIQLTQIAIELDEGNGWARRLNMELYEKLKMYTKALESAKQALDFVTEKENWKQHIERLETKIENSPNKR